MRGVLEPVGGPVSRLLFGGYATAVLLFVLKTYASALGNQPEHLLEAPGAWVLHALAASAAALLVAGPCPLLLLLSGTIALRSVLSNHIAEEPLLWFPAAEWPLFVALPFAGLLGIRGGDEAVRSAFRIAGMAALFFAGFHKLNTDFFDPTVTCNRLVERLSTWWALPASLHAWVRPGVVVAMELTAPLLCVLAPRLGALFSVAMLLHFTAIGATALSSIIAVCCVAALPSADFQTIRTLRVPMVLAGIASAITSALLYRGPWSWPQYGLTHALFGATLFFLSVRLVRAGPGRMDDPFAVARIPLGFFALAWLLNGFAPYTGIKFQYSFAMLSNLRVDDDRHNSLLIPRWLRLTAHDPYVHVDRATYRDRTGRPLRGGAVRPDLWAPYELIRQRTIARDVGETLHIRGTWKGRPITEAALDDLPPAHLFQKRLTRGGPQQCVH